VPGLEDELPPIDLSGQPAIIIGGAIRDSGLVSPGDSGLVLISGGADSVALLLGLAAVMGTERLLALHVNYGLRAEADADQELVRKVCADLGVELVIHEAGRPDGNIQAWARRVRLERAEEIRSERQADWIAVGHNRTDLAETFLYRLASSPGVRSLLAMPPRSGRVIRPLLSLDRGLIRRLLEPDVPYAEDATNQDPTFARNRIRHELLDRLEQIDSRAELNIVRTRAELAEDEELITGLAAAAVEQALPQPDLGLEGSALTREHPAVARRMLRQYAERELDRPVAVNPRLAGEVMRLATEPEGGALDLGDGDRFLIESGRVRVVSGGGTGREEVPPPIQVKMEPASTAFGDWILTLTRTDEEQARRGFGDPWWAFIDGDGLDELLREGSPGLDHLSLNLRAWRSGDRIEPLGMTGSKSLQDVFTDALVPASRRRSWPVLVVEETVVWVPGLVRSRHLLVGGPDKPVLRLHARPPFSI
jgi:tRNA(Ile)-lysidine synthase